MEIKINNVITDNIVWYYHYAGAIMEFDELITLDDKEYYCMYKYNINYKLIYDKCNKMDMGLKPNKPLYIALDECILLQSPTMEYSIMDLM